MLAPSSAPAPPGRPRFYRVAARRRGSFGAGRAVGTLGRVGSRRGLLHEDEELLAEVRPHPMVVFGPIALMVLAIAAAIAIAVHYPGAPVSAAWALAAMVALPALWTAARVARWRSVRFSVTSHRLLYRRGVLGRDVVQLRLQRVAEVHCSQTLFERAVGSGRLVFEVAGAEAPLVIDDVRRPRRLQRVITTQLDLLDPAPPLRAARSGYARRMAAADAEWPAVGTERSGRSVRPRGRTWTDTPPHGVSLDGDGGGGVPAQLLQLDELRRRGILSEAEFSAKKAELLSRL